MFYIYGDDDYLIEEKINEIINSSNPAPSILSLNNEHSLEEIVNQISTFSLFDENRIIIFKDFQYINKPSSNQNEINLIIKSLNFKPDSTSIIFTSKKMNEKTKQNDLFYFLKEKAKCFECNNLSDKEMATYIKNKITSLNGTISDMDLFYLLSKFPNKLSLIVPEIEKLISLDKNISKTNIDELIQKYDMSTAFDFINAIQDLNNESLIHTYIDKISRGEMIRNLMSQLTNVFELCSRIYSLKKSNHSDADIEKITKKHSFVIKKNIDFLNQVGYAKIQNYLKMLAELDIKIKIGKIDEKFGFERLLLEIIKI